MSERRERGSVLIAALALIGVLIAVILSLSHSQRVGRAAERVEQRELLSYQAARYALAASLSNVTEFRAPASEVTASAELDGGLAGNVGAPLNVSRGLFGSNGLPDLIHNREVQGLLVQGDALCGRVQLSSSSLPIPPGTIYRSIATTAPEYAVLAPTGRVTLQGLQGWSNEGDGRCAVPVKVGARQVVCIATAVPYGQVWCADPRPHTVVNGNCPVFAGQIPGGQVTNVLQGELERLSDAVRQRVVEAACGELLRSPWITTFRTVDGQDMYEGAWSTQSGGPSAFANWVPSCMTLGLAHSFPIPLLKTFKSAGSGFWAALHIPRPPGLHVSTLAPPTLEEQEQLSELASGRGWAGWAYAGLGPAPMGFGEPLYGIPLGPGFKSREPLVMDQPFTDASNWTVPYSSINLQTYHDPAVSQGPRYLPQPLLMLGRTQKFSEFDFSSGAPDTTVWPILEPLVAMAGTLCVPPGRTLHVGRTLRVEDGDVWLQRGSALVVDGDLLIKSLNRSPGGPLSPKSRLIMEPGSTVVVSGTVSVSGPLVVTRPADPGVQPVTRGLIAGSKIWLGQGMQEGVGLNDVLYDLGSPLSDLPGILANAAKLAGPFTARKPYFAEYAATLLIQPQSTGPPQVTPQARPVPNLSNALLTLFGAVAAEQMNAAWGDNLLTYCSWWPWGDGAVPVVPASAQTARFLRDRARAVSFSGLKQELEGSIRSRREGRWAPMASASPSELAAPLGPLLTEAVQAAPPAPAADAEFGAAERAAYDRIVAMVTPDPEPERYRSRLENLLAPLSGLAAEVPASPSSERAGVQGLLIYSRNSSITIANSSVSAGLFVAKDDITVDSDLMVGALISLAGDVQARSVAGYLPFYDVGLYLPRRDPSGRGPRRLEWPLETSYGSDFNSNEGLGVDCRVRRLIAEGWDVQ